MRSFITRLTPYARPKSAESGAVAILFALLVIPVLGLIGLSVDSIRLFQTRQDLYQALEVALHAGLTGRSPEDATARAQHYFEVNWKAGHHEIPEDGSLSVSITSQPGTGIVVANARYNMPTIFMRAMGIPHVTISATVEADALRSRQRLR